MSIKRMFLIQVLIASGLVINASPTTQSNWTPVSQEQKEYEFLSDQCNRFAAYCSQFGGGLSSSGYYGTVFLYLRNIGTPVSLKVLKDQVAIGRLPKHCLDRI